MFNNISKHLEVFKKYSATCRIFNSLLSVWKCGKTLSFVFNTLHQKACNPDSSKDEVEVPESKLGSINLCNHDEDLEG